MQLTKFSFLLTKIVAALLGAACAPGSIPFLGGGGSAQQRARACYVGGGELGYCTRICDSFADCPMGWDCQRAGNAPQKICQQDQD